jgi:hypothetical protein
MISAEEYRASISEADFTEKVITQAESAGWLVYHIPDWMWRAAFASWKATGARAGRRWPVRGFPDLVLIRPPELLAVELKTTYGRRSVDQSRWETALVKCGLSVELWRPRDWRYIEARLAPREESHAEGV